MMVSKHPAGLYVKYRKSIYSETALESVLFFVVFSPEICKWWVSYLSHNYMRPMLSRSGPWPNASSNLNPRSVENSLDSLASYTIINTGDWKLEVTRHVPRISMCHVEHALQWQTELSNLTGNNYGTIKATAFVLLLGSHRRINDFQV